MPATRSCVEWCGEYEIHYHCSLNDHAVVAGPAVVYFPLTREALACDFVPTPGLGDPASPDFVAAARSTTSGTSPAHDGFVVAPDGIRFNCPYGAALGRIVARLVETGGFRHVFRPSSPPDARWENVQLTRLPVPPALDAYCAALREEYRNGFVEVVSYRIEPGAIEDAVIAQRHYSRTPSQFLEILRHPQVNADFRIGKVNGERLFPRGKWAHLSPFLFSGFLAQTLVAGGAYSPFPASASAVLRALQLADEVFSAFQRNYQDLELHTSHEPWCERFHDIAWDHTWIVSEASARRLTILLASDTD